MSLSEVVLEIADDMEEASVKGHAPELKLWAKQLRRAVKACEPSPLMVASAEPLRIQEAVVGAVEKVLGGTHLPNQPAPVITPAHVDASVDPWEVALKKYKSVKKEEEEVQKDKDVNNVAGQIVDVIADSRLNRKQQIKQVEEMAVRYEEHGGGMAVCDGGNWDGDFVPTDPKTPIGAKTLISGQVYVMEKDRRWHYSEEETDKMKVK